MTKFWLCFQLIEDRAVATPTNKNTNKIFLWIDQGPELFIDRRRRIWSHVVRGRRREPPLLLTEPLVCNPSG
ncbi:MAG: hypothetical protein EOR71_33280 [Mesorhizobium sp.]|nr:MAG: hypothetical protein EOR71_33280 [Mesorhizobium sp.]